MESQLGNSIEKTDENGLEIELPTGSPIRKSKSGYCSPTNSKDTINLNETSEKPPKGRISKVSLSCSSTPQSFIIEELGGLQHQIQEINSKLAKNISILEEKRAKNKQLKTLIKKIENRTLPTDISFEEINPQCPCTTKCVLF